MTIVEACQKALTEIGGRAPLKYIYLRVKELVTFTGRTPEASIRAELQYHPECFRPCNGEKGWWELSSYKEEVSLLKARIAELEAENQQLRNMETADAFIKRFVEATKNVFQVERKKADGVRLVLLNLNKKKEQQELADWMDKKVTKKNITQKFIQNNINSQVISGSVTDSEFKVVSSNGELRQ